MPTALLTLEELSARVALALAADSVGQPSGRVREVPDARTIRYYTTLGLVDRPAALRGRTALYGRKHLLQLVAIKRLQARGDALADVQHRLVGLSEAALARLARLPADLDAEPMPAEKTRPRERFWAAEPAPAGSAGASPSLESPAELVGVPLDGGVTLLLQATRNLDEYDRTALRVAAAPLLKLLRVRRLVGPHAEPTPTKGDAP